MLPEIFGLIQCTIGCVIVFKHSQKVVRHRKWVLHPVVAPIRDPKNASKCPQNYYFGDVKIDFFLGRGHSPFPRPLPRTPPRPRIAPPPFSNPKYATEHTPRYNTGFQASFRGAIANIDFLSLTLILTVIQNNLYYQTHGYDKITVKIPPNIYKRYQNDVVPRPLHIIEMCK